MKIEQIHVSWDASVRLSNDETLLLLHALKYYVEQGRATLTDPKMVELRQKASMAGFFEMLEQETEAARKLHNEFLPAFGPDREHLAL